MQFLFGYNVDAHCYLFKLKDYGFRINGWSVREQDEHGTLRRNPWFSSDREFLA